MLRAKRCVLPASATLTSADLQWNGGYGADSDPSRGGHCTGAIRSFEPFRGGCLALDLRHQLPPAVVATGRGRAISSDRLSIPPVEIGGGFASRRPSFAASQKQHGPRRLWRCGALFRPLRNFWDVADHIAAELALGLRARRRGSCSQRFRSALPLWHVERGRRLDPGRAQGHSFMPGGVMATPSFCLPSHRPAVASPSHCLFMTT
jgi:hypothetical protein